MKKTKILPWILDLLINGIIIYILVVLIQSYLIAPFNVSGSSMCPTLNQIDGVCQNSTGERIIINVAKYVFGETERGDVVVFKSSKVENEKHFIKRVIGLPGETVKIENGEVYIKKANTNKFIQINEPYLGKENKGNTKLHFSDFNEYKVPEGNYFVMGDNRRASTDSRSCFSSIISIKCNNTSPEAFVPKEDINGATMFVWWPISTIRRVEKATYPNLED